MMHNPPHPGELLREEVIFGSSLPVAEAASRLAPSRVALSRVLMGRLRLTDAKFYSGQGDLSVTRKFDTPLDTHDIRVGVYGADWAGTVFAVYQNYLLHRHHRRASHMRGRDYASSAHPHERAGPRYCAPRHALDTFTPGLPAARADAGQAVPPCISNAAAAL